MANVAEHTSNFTLCYLTDSIVVSSQEREISVLILSRFAKLAFLFFHVPGMEFPRVRVPNMPETREHGNAKPVTLAHLCYVSQHITSPLQFSLSLTLYSLSDSP